MLTFWHDQIYYVWFTQKKKVKVDYLTEEEIKYMIDDKQRKLGCEESEEPLWGVHVGSKTEVHEVIKQIR